MTCGSFWRRSLRGWPVTLLLFLALVGCGGNDSGDADAAPDDARLADAADADAVGDLGPQSDSVFDGVGDADGTPPVPTCRYTPSLAPNKVRALHHGGSQPVYPFPSDRFTKPATAPATGQKLFVAPGSNVLTDEALGFLMAPSLMAGLLAYRDGFPVRSPLLIPFSGPLTPEAASLDASRSLSDGAIALMVKLDASGACSERIPITTELFDGQGPDGELTLLVARAQVPLLPATRYALVVTRALTDAEGLPVAADSEFEVPAELDCLQAAPLSLCSEDVVTATLFTTSDAAARLEEIRAWLAGPQAPDLKLTVEPAVLPQTLDIWPDTVTSFPATSAVIRGSFMAPDLRNQQGDIPQALGDPIVPTGTIPIPFLLLLPAESVPGPWPVAVLAHGKNGSKERMAYLAQRFGEAGIALAAIDAAGHGELEAYGNFDTYDIPVLRGSYVQSQVDMLVFFRVIQQLSNSDFLPSAQGDGVAELDLSGGIGYVGESMGGILGGAACAVEPAVSSVVLNVAGGGLAEILLAYVSALIPKGKELTSLALEALVQPLLEPADPLAFAQRMQNDESGRSVLMQAVVLDDTVPNSSTNLLAQYLGLTQVCPCALDVSSLPQTQAPASVDGLTYFADASHGFLLKNASNPAASDSARRQAAHFITSTLTQGQGEVLYP